MKEQKHSPDQSNKMSDDSALVRFMKSLGFMAEKVEITAISAADLEIMMKSKSPPVLLDVREARELNDRLGHIKGILNIPVMGLKKRITELDDNKDDEIVVVCRSGARAVSAAKTLKRAGFPNVDVLSGGMMEWNRHQATR